MEVEKKVLKFERVMRGIAPDIMYWELTRRGNGNFDVVYIERYTRTDHTKEELERAMASAMDLANVMLAIAVPDLERRPVLSRTQDGVMLRAKDVSPEVVLALMEGETLIKDGEMKWSFERGGDLDTLEWSARQGKPKSGQICPYVGCRYVDEDFDWETEERLRAHLKYAHGSSW